MEKDKIETTNTESKPKKPRKKIVIARQLSQKQRSTAERNIYLDKAEFAAEIAKWRDSAERVEDRVMHDRLALMILSIPQHLLQSRCFRGYDYHLKEDMVMNAYLKIVKNLKNFKPEIGASAFKYFSRCAYFAFCETIMSYYKHKNMIEELTEAAKRNMKSLGLSPRNLDDTLTSDYADC